MVFYRRRLPHWQPDNKSIFVTWRLHGSLPKDAKPNPRTNKDANKDTNKKMKDFPSEEFFSIDQLLDQGAIGPLWLREPRIADMVVAALLHGEQHLNQYKLSAYVVMANHVHMLLRPLQPLEKIMRALKGVTARAANQALQRTGQRFWQEESFDHWVRSEGSFDRIVRYIEYNPVKAGLVAKPEDWSWSSAFK